MHACAIVTLVYLRLDLDWRYHLVKVADLLAHLGIERVSSTKQLHCERHSGESHDGVRPCGEGGKECVSCNHLVGSVHDNGAALIDDDSVWNSPFDIDCLKHLEHIVRIEARAVTSVRGPTNSRVK